MFPLDGDVADADSNVFEFFDDNTAIRRIGRLPRERESCVALIGLGNERKTNLGFSDIDLVVIDAVIQKRLKENQYQRDENGDIWEERATLRLPCKCDPKLYNKKGEQIEKFRLQSNDLGFYWCYFWLLAWNPSERKRAQRSGGKSVTVMSNEESSIYTEKSVATPSNVRPGKRGKRGKH